MKTTYLKEFINLSEKGIAYLPIGTIEWHGNHLPIETDFLVAEKLCEKIAEKVPGYILPPFYLGTDKTREKDGQKLDGMNWYLGKELSGSLYWLKPERLYEIVSDLADNLIKQGFNKIFIISGHGGSKHVEILQKIAKDKTKVYFISPFANLGEYTVDHADEHETSVFWALYPEEEVKSRAVEISKDDDYVKFKGYDPRVKASFELGREMLDKIIEGCLDQIEKAL